MGKTPKFLQLITLVIFLVACGRNESQSLPPAFVTIVPIEEPESSYLHIEVDSVTLLKSPMDLDRVAEFRLMMLVTDGDSINGALLCPGDLVIKAEVGDIFSPCNLAISIKEEMLDESLNIFFMGVDDDAGNFLTDFGKESTIQLLSRAVMKIVSSSIKFKSIAGGPVVVAVEFLLETIISQLAEEGIGLVFEESQVLGVQIYRLTKNDDWMQGRQITFESADKGMQLTFNVKRGVAPNGLIVEGNTQKADPGPNINGLDTLVRGRTNFPSVELQKPSLSDMDRIPSIWDVNNIPPLDLPEPDERRYKVGVKAQDTLTWVFYWCASNKRILEENLKVTEVAFFVDGYRVDDSLILRYPRDITGWACQYWATILTGWEADKIVQLDVLYRFQTNVNDGYKTYPLGDYHYILSVDVR